MKDVATTAMEGARAYDGGVYIGVTVVILASILIGIVLWKIAIPNSQATRESGVLFAKAIDTMSGVMTRSVQLTESIDSRTKTIEAEQLRHRDFNYAVTHAVEKIAKSTETDIGIDLGEMRGSLGRSARREEVREDA
jgi:hypothetical protein